MACTELFGVIAVAFEFIRYTEHRLLFSSFDKNYCSVFSINITHYLNRTMSVVSGCGYNDSTHKISLPTPLKTSLG